MCAALFGGNLEQVPSAHSFCSNHCLSVSSLGIEGTQVQEGRRRGQRGRGRGETKGSRRSPVATRTENHGGQKDWKGWFSYRREFPQPLALKGRDRPSSSQFMEPRESRSSVLLMN